MASIISQHLLSVSQHLSQHHDLLASTVAYPLPTFPGRTEENLLGQLLRKKLEPSIEGWLESSRDQASRVHHDGSNADGVHRDSGGGKLREKAESDWKDLWNWAGRAANEEARRRNWGDDFSLEEREAGIAQVVTGLKRGPHDDDDDDDDDGDDDDDEVEGHADIKGRRSKNNVDVEREIESKTAKGKSALKACSGPEPPTKPLPLVDLLRFMSTGAEPRGESSMMTHAPVLPRQGLRR